MPLCPRNHDESKQPSLFSTFLFVFSWKTLVNHVARRFTPTPSGRSTALQCGRGQCSEASARQRASPSHLWVCRCPQAQVRASGTRPSMCPKSEQLRNTHPYNPKKFNRQQARISFLPLLSPHRLHTESWKLPLPFSSHLCTRA